MYQANFRVLRLLYVWFVCLPRSCDWYNPLSAFQLAIATPLHVDPKMLAHLWKFFSAVYEALRYSVYGSLGFFCRILPSPIRSYLFTRGESDDIESRGGPITRNDSATVAKNQTLETSEDQAILPDGIPNPVIYEPRLGETLSQGSTSLIVRLKPGVVVKCPRYSWWHSGTVDTTSFVKDIKHSFEVEEQLFDILGTHPRIIRYVIQIPYSPIY